MLQTIASKLQSPYAGMRMRLYKPRRMIHSTNALTQTGSIGHPVSTDDIFENFLVPGRRAEPTQQASPIVAPKTFRLLSPEYALPAAQCVAETFGQLNDPFT